MEKRPTMKRLVAKTVLLFILLPFSILPCFAYFQDCNFCLDPYVGSDAGFRHITYGGGGNKLFRTNYPQISIYGGFRFIDYLGLEVGYRISTLKSKFVRLDAGDLVLGVPVADTPNDYIARSQFKGWYGSFLGYFPVCDYPIDILGSIGLVELRTYHYQSLLIFNDPVTMEPTAANIFGNGRTYKKRKTLFTLGLGAQYCYCDTVGLRFKVDWENTDRIRNIKPLEGLGGTILNLKNSINYNLGLFVPF